MPSAAPISPAAGGSASLDARFAAQRDAFAREPYPTLRVRRDRVARLRALVRDEVARLCDAVDADFGRRPAQETRLAELHVVAAEARHALRALPRWMHRERVATPWHLQPAHAFVMRQPVGVAGIVSPWNYPVQLALAPAVAALAAGCRAMLKPSELAPATSAVLREAIARRFAADELAVAEGDAAVGRAFVALPFDHLFFTGSTAVGREVALAAARNLTPVTLELGGKSPALIAPGADLSLAAARIAAGKWLNAGQTCIAPDYVQIDAARADALVAALRDAVATLYPEGLARDYASIVSPRHHARLAALAADARAKGATLVELGTADAAARVFPPTLVVGAEASMDAMREEIFGPLLPIEIVRDEADALARVNARPHPLAFYYFGNMRGATAALRATRAGGATVNDTLWHFAHPELPFGGIGAAGYGAYHGEAGFLAFSHRKPVFVQRRLAFARALAPPYGARFERLLALLDRFNG
ncbi:MAG TPA: aldehyde dehydrogenase family protein [Casimicrobiaceae bacterium]|jgi:coniferyl-aldehyde dehydrogenase|nr:aldehyde dehydrogenase family protein [Casimicrobiaceae bacterium]